MPFYLLDCPFLCFYYILLSMPEMWISDTEPILHLQHDFIIVPSLIWEMISAAKCPRKSCFNSQGLNIKFENELLHYFRGCLLWSASRFLIYTKSISHYNSFYFRVYQIFTEHSHLNIYREEKRDLINSPRFRGFLWLVTRIVFVRKRGRALTASTSGVWSSGESSCGVESSLW